MINAQQAFTKKGLRQPASWQVAGILELNGLDRKWLAAELGVILLTVNRWFSGGRGCSREQRQKIQRLLAVPMDVPWFPERRIYANGTDMGTFEGKDAQAALETYARDAGYKSWADLRLRAPEPSRDETLQVMFVDGEVELDLSLWEECIAAVIGLTDDERADWLRHCQSSALADAIETEMLPDDGMVNPWEI